MKALALVLALTIAPMWAQKLDFNFDSLAAKAKEKQEVDLEGDLIAKMASDLKVPLASVSRVTVRHYEFEKPGQFSMADLAGLRKQATDGGWTAFIKVKEDDESTEIYGLKKGDEIAGLLLITAEDDELTVVYVAGSLPLEHLKAVVESSINYDLKALEQ